MSLGGASKIRGLIQVRDIDTHGSYQSTYKFREVDRKHLAQEWNVYDFPQKVWCLIIHNRVGDRLVMPVVKIAKVIYKENINAASYKQLLMNDRELKPILNKFFHCHLEVISE